MFNLQKACPQFLTFIFKQHSNRSYKGLKIIGNGMTKLNNKKTDKLYVR